MVVIEFVLTKLYTTIFGIYVCVACTYGLQYKVPLIQPTNQPNEQDKVKEVPTTQGPYHKAEANKYTEWLKSSR